MTDSVTTLHDIATEYAEVRDRVESVREQDLKAVRDAYHEIIGLFDRYEERATDWDDFEGYVEFQSELVDLIDGLPDDLPGRDGFEAADERLHQQTLSASDFEHARSDLQAAADHAALYDRIQELREDYRNARYSVRQEREAIDERCARLERIKQFEGIDLDTPVDRIREPIEQYNRAVAEDFRAFVEENSAREVLSLVATTDVYPLIDYQQPPAALRTYVETQPAGTESIPDLLQYAGYSRSKLDHYVDDPQELKAAVRTSRTYLNRLDSGPLALDWPPPRAETLRFQIRERIAIVGRFAPDDTVVRLRRLRALSQTPSYDRLRQTAIARDELDDDARDRLRNGTIHRDLEQARAEYERLDDALDAFPGPDR